MPEQLLHGPNVVPVLEQMGRERVPEGVWADTLRDVGLIRFRGHLPKGGYDVQDVQRVLRPAATPAVF